MYTIDSAALLFKAQLLAQAYGEGSYNEEIYSCAPGDESCLTTGTPEPEVSVSPVPGGETTQPGAGAPNTGFLGLSSDAALLGGGGLLLVVVAIAGVVTVLLSKRRAKKDRS